jgi:hypothetical protein
MKQTGFLPHLKVVVGCAACHQTPRNGFPLTARAQVVENPIHDPARVDPRAAPFGFGWLRRQQRDDQSPQGVGNTPLGVYFYINVHSILSCFLIFKKQEIIPH